MRRAARNSELIGNSKYSNTSWRHQTHSAAVLLIARREMANKNYFIPWQTNWYRFLVPVDPTLTHSTDFCYRFGLQA